MLGYERIDSIDQRLDRSAHIAERFQFYRLARLPFLSGESLHVDRHPRVEKFLLRFELLDIQELRRSGNDPCDMLLNTGGIRSVVC